MRLVGKGLSGDGCRSGDRPGDCDAIRGQRRHGRLHRCRRSGQSATPRQASLVPTGGSWMSPRSAEVEEVIASVAASLGSLDVLVNNAGVNTLHDRVTIDRFPRAEWDRLLAVDLTGLYDVSRFAPG